MRKGRPTHYYRWVFRLLGAYAIGFAVVAVLLLVSITDANAGLPALFFGGALVATAVPAFAIGAVLAGFSLAKGEPHRSVMLGIIIVSCLVIWAFHATFFAFGQLLAQIVSEPGFLGPHEPKASAVVVAPNGGISLNGMWILRGSRIDGVRSELARRGYRLVHSDGSVGAEYWWDENDRGCVLVHFQQRLVDDVESLPSDRCSRAMESPERKGGTDAVVGGSK